MTTMTKTLIASLASLVMIPAAALAAPSVGDTVGTTVEEITGNLQNAGYEVREVEAEDDELEAVIVADGQLLEVEVSRQTGLIISIEVEDDSEYGDDDDDTDDDMRSSN